MFDESYYISLAVGKERINYLKKCIDEADKSKDFKTSLTLRYLHIKESTFNEDNLDSLIVFPEYMALYDKYPDLHDRYTFMYAFKWIIESIMNFPQVSIEMAESYFEEFKRRCEMYGYTLKVYYMKQINFFEKIDPERVMKLLELFRAEESDDISDGKADDISLEICTELDYGSEERALKLLNEMRRTGLRSGEVPQITYGKCVEYFTKKGNIKEAEYYADLLIPMTRGTDTYYMMEMSNVMILKSFTDPKTALSIFNRYVEYFISGKNVKFRFYFASAAYRLFKMLAENGYDTIPIKMPRAFALYNESGEYKTEELSRYFKEQGRELAEKFDKRNRNTMYSDMLNFEYPKVPVERLDLPEHPTTKRRPVTLIVPFLSAETLPTASDIIKAVERLSDTVVKGSRFDEADEVFSVRIYNEEKDLESEFYFENRLMGENEINIWEAGSFHHFADGELSGAEDKFKAYLTINTYYNKNAESYEFNCMLKLADMLNSDKSPAIFDMSSFKMLSAKWVRVQAKTDIPPYEFYMYTVFVDRAKDGEKRNITTCGLSKFGYRDILIPNVEERDVGAAYELALTIARSVCSYQPIPDKGEKAFMNAFYFDKTPVYYSWIRADEIDNDFSDEVERFIVPVIHFSYDGAAIVSNKITDEDCRKISFRAPNRFYNIDSALCNERFKAALNIFLSGKADNFYVGFELPDPNNEEEYIEIYAQAENADDLTAVVFEDTGREGLSEGDKVKINPETVYCWRLEKNGKDYFADNIYLFEEE